MKGVSMWDASKVINLCIKNEYYTHGTNDEYGKMLQYVEQHQGSEDEIRLVATDIAIRSGIGLFQENFEEWVERISNELLNL